MTRLRFVMAAALIALAPQAHAAAILSASMSLKGVVEVGGVSSSFFALSSWGPPLSPLLVGGATNAADQQGRSGRVFGLGTASWASANAGSVVFDDYGWDLRAAGASSTSVSLNSALPDWQYSFVADAFDTGISMTYDVFGTGDTFGLWGWSIIVDGGPQGTQALYVSNPTDPTANGVFNAVLTPGQTYTMRLENNANLSNTVAGFNAAGRMDGDFRWQITHSAVPEPHTYALVLLGLAAFGARARRFRG